MERGKKALPFAALSAMALAHVVPLLFGGRVLAKNDFLASALPALASLRGHLPFFGAPSWTDAVFGGAPEEVLAAMPRYPLNLFAYLAAPETALALFVGIHLALAAIGAWSFVRRVGGTSPAAAMFGAMAWTFGGALWLRGQHPDYLAVAAWMPFVLRAAWEITATGSLRRRQAFAALLGLSGGMVLLTGGGAPIIVLLALSCVAIIADASAMRADLHYPRGRALVEALPWLAAGGAAGVAIGAPGLVPFAEAVRGGARSVLTLRETGGFSLTPPSLARLFVPDLLLGGGTWYWPQYVERWLYVGVLALPLVAIGARDARGRFFLLCAVAALVLGLGLWGPLHYVFYYLLPGYSHFRAPGRWGIVACLALATLAARGLDAVLLDSRARVLARKLVPQMAVLAAAALLLAFLGKGETMRVAHGGLLFFALQAFLAAAWLHGAAREPGALTNLDERRPHHGGSHAAANAHKREKHEAHELARRERVIAIAALVLLGADLGGTMLRLRLPEESAAIAEPEILRVAATVAGNTRIAHDDSTGSAPLNGGVRWGYRNARGYSQIVPARYARLLEGEHPTGARHLAALRSPDAALLHLLGVGAWVGDAALPPPPGFEPLPIARSGSLAVWRSATPPLTAALVTSTEAEAGEKVAGPQALALDPAMRASVDRGVGLDEAAPGSGGKVTLERRGSDEVALHADATADSLLVLADAWHPRWSVTVDGKPAEVVRADSIWRGVKVSTGAHEVVFSCRSAAPWWSWLLLLAGGAGAASLWWRPKGSLA